MPPADGDRGAGPGAAGQSLAHTAFEFPESYAAALHDLHESHVGAPRKTRVMFDTRPKPLERRGFHIGYPENCMRIAHRDRPDLDISAVDLQRVSGGVAASIHRARARL